MANNSSRKKRTKKAATPNRSTSSSTTALTPLGETTATTDLEMLPSRKKTGLRRRTPKKLTSREQDLILELLLKGASPLAACMEVDCSFESYQRTLDDDDEFQSRFRDVQAALIQNISARLYQAAMKGSVSAMTFWLKHFGPAAEVTSANDSPIAPEIESLTDDEVRRLCSIHGLEVPVESQIERDSPDGT